MRLPVMPPVKPMLAKACDLDDPELLKWIEQESVAFEPKWDGSRWVTIRARTRCSCGMTP
jgi:ATP-dependent DNA ligase